MHEGALRTLKKKPSTTEERASDPNASVVYQKDESSEDTRRFPLPTGAFVGLDLSEKQRSTQSRSEDEVPVLLLPTSARSTPPNQGSEASARSEAFKTSEEVEEEDVVVLRSVQQDHDAEALVLLRPISGETEALPARNQPTDSPLPSRRASSMTQDYPISSPRIKLSEDLPPARKQEATDAHATLRQTVAIGSPHPSAAAASSRKAANDLFPDIPQASSDQTIAYEAAHLHALLTPPPSSTLSLGLRPSFDDLAASSAEIPSSPSQDKSTSPPPSLETTAVSASEVLGVEQNPQSSDLLRVIALNDGDVTDDLLRIIAEQHLDRVTLEPMSSTLGPPEPTRKVQPPTDDLVAFALKQSERERAKPLLPTGEMIAFSLQPPAPSPMPSLAPSPARSSNISSPSPIRTDDPSATQAFFSPEDSRIVRVYDADEQEGKPNPTQERAKDGSDTDERPPYRDTSDENARPSFKEGHPPDKEGHPSQSGEVSAKTSPDEIAAISQEQMNALLQHEQGYIHTLETRVPALETRVPALETRVPPPIPDVLTISAEEIQAISPEDAANLPKRDAAAISAEEVQAVSPEEAAELPEEEMRAVSQTLPPKAETHHTSHTRQQTEPHEMKGISEDELGGSMAGTHVQHSHPTEKNTVFQATSADDEIPLAEVTPSHAPVLTHEDLDLIDPSSADHEIPVGDTHDASAEHGIPVGDAQYTADDLPMFEGTSADHEIPVGDSTHEHPDSPSDGDLPWFPPSSHPSQTPQSIAVQRISQTTNTQIRTLQPRPELFAPPASSPALTPRPQFTQAEDSPAQSKQTAPRTTPPETEPFPPRPSSASNPAQRAIRVEVLRPGETFEEKRVADGVLLEGLLSELALHCGRACCFLLKEGALIGLGARGKGDVHRRILDILLPADAPSLFSHVIRTRSSYLGPPASGPIDRILTACLGGKEPQEIAIYPILQSHRVVALFYLDDAGVGHFPKTARYQQPCRRAPASVSWRSRPRGWRVFPTGPTLLEKGRFWGSRAYAIRPTTGRCDDRQRTH